MTRTRLRVALVADLLSERWPSMDLIADSLDAALRRGPFVSAVEVTLLRPDLASRSVPIGRYVRRYWDYSRWLRRRAREFDVFHVVDHSYAHLVHALPSARTVVTCHDADAFMPLVDSTVIPSRLPKAVTRYILSGMRKAAVVTCDSTATRDELLAHRFADASRLTVIPLAPNPDVTAEPGADAHMEIERVLGPLDPGRPELLHVGSCIPRKRIDVLLRILAGMRGRHPGVRLLKAGGALTPEQSQLARDLGVSASVVSLPFLSAPVLGALYRRADVVLVTSEREGFGLPVAEALSCGTPVVASDLAVLREVGGEAALYAPVGDIQRWCDGIVEALAGRMAANAPMQSAARHAQSARFTWPACAEAMVSVYRKVAESPA